MLIKLPFSLSITGLTSLLIYVQVAGLPVPHPPTLLPVHMCFLIWDRWSVGPTSFWSNALAPENEHVAHVGHLGRVPVASACRTNALARPNMPLMSVTLAVLKLSIDWLNAPAS